MGAFTGAACAFIERSRPLNVPPLSPRQGTHSLQVPARAVRTHATLTKKWRQDLVKRSPIAVAMAIMALAAACGGGDKGVTNPPAGTFGSITVTPAALTLAAGAQQTITVQAKDTQNQAISGGASATFSSSAPAIAAVTSGGVVTGLAAGSATITASLTLSGITKTATATVAVNGSLPVTATVVAGAATNDFTPPSVAIARGGTVTWTFGGRTHNVEFAGTSGAPANIVNTSGASVNRTFANSGNFGYTCTLHGGMSGTVVVP